MFDIQHERTALHLASLNGRTDIVKLLVAAGSDFNLQDKRGCTALHFASKQGHLLIVEHLVAHHLIDLDVQNRVYTYIKQFTIDITSNNS